MIIEDLLKMGKGDEGRLLYLRKALTLGKAIYESDKKYLKKMQKETDLTSGKITNTTHFEKLDKDRNQNSVSGFELEKLNRNTPNEKPNFDNFDSEIQNIQMSLEDLKRKESRIKDNLGLLLINREISLQHSVDKSNSFGTFSYLSKSASSDLFDLLDRTPTLRMSKLSGLSNYDLMTYFSVGFFSLWVAGYQNLIDLGPIQGLSLGFSAGSALSAGMLYFKEKNRK